MNLKPETEEFAKKVFENYQGKNIWVVIEKGYHSGWFFKFYLLLYNPKSGQVLYYKAWRDEYVSIPIGAVVCCPSCKKVPCECTNFPERSGR